VASREQPIRLDTGAFASARAVRLTRALGYWVLLVAVVTVVGTAFAFAARALGGGASARRRPVAARTVARSIAARRSPVVPMATVPEGPQLTAARTPVTVWNGFGGKGAASATASRVHAAGYPLATVGNAPRGSYRQTMVYYSAPAHDAAWALAARLGLRPHDAVRPLDGLTPRQIRPARIVVVLGG
jgi:hypothetical protein